MQIFDTENIKTHERSYAIYQLLGKEPSWIIKFGLWIMMIIITLLVVSSFIIKYPDVVKSQFVLSSTNPPQRIICKSSGKLILFVKNGQHVSSGTILGAISNAANFKDVMEVKKKVLLLLGELNDGEKKAFDMETSTYNLGELQVYYQDLIKSFEVHKLIMRLNQKDQKIQFLDRQVIFLQRMRMKLKDQEELSISEYKYNKNKIGIDSLLYSKKVLSRSEYEKSVRDLIPYQKAIIQSKQNSFQNEITISQLSKDLNEVSFNNVKELQNIEIEIQAKANTLLSNIATWEDGYLFRANITGIVNFSKIWQDGDNLNSTEEFVSIIPNIVAAYGIATVPNSGIGKVKMGQKALITLEGYQNSEFGFVVGFVSGISPIPNKGTYLMNISLPRGLLTTYNKQIESKPELSGTADIITSDMRLVDRVLSQIRIILLNK